MVHEFSRLIARLARIKFNGLRNLTIITTISAGSKNGEICTRTDVEVRQHRLGTFPAETLWEFMA